MSKIYPCDILGDDNRYHCPYANNDEDANVSCRDMCGLGVDESESIDESGESENDVYYGDDIDTSEEIDSNVDNRDDEKNENEREERDG